MRRMAAALVLLLIAASSNPARVQGTFVIDHTDAQLKFARAKQVKLDEKGHMGYAVLLSAREAKGDIEQWRTADPKERGSFVHVIFDPKGEVWVAELGHVKAKTGRFGVVSEVKKVAFEVKDHRVIAHIKTDGEQVFTEDKYSLDLSFDVPIE